MKTMRPRKPFGQVARELGLVGSFAGAPDLGERHSQHFRRALRAKANRARRVRKDPSAIR